MKAYKTGEHHFDVRLAPARQLDLRVVDYDGVPFKHVGVRVINSDGDEVQISQGRMMTNRVRTNAAGTALLAPLPAGPITVFIAHAGAEREFPIDLTRSIEGSYEIEIELERVEPIEVNVAALLTSLPANAEPLRHRRFDSLDQLVAVLPKLESTQPEGFLDADEFSAQLIDAAGKLHGTSSGRRQSDRSWRIKTRHYKGGSTTPSELAGTELQAIYPEFPLRLVIEIDGHEPFDEFLDVTAEEPDAALVVYIRRSE